MIDSPHKESSKSRGKRILESISRFSATERAVFGLFLILALASAVIMTKWVNDSFTVEVPAYGGSLTEGLVGLPRTINPVLAITDVDRDISALIYSGLAKYVDGQLVTDMAQSYEISDDGLIYSFTLKPKLHFHDGTPLTTEDIAFTIQKIQDPAIKSPRRADWADVSVNIISSDKIEFTLKQPYSPFLSNTVIGILPKHIWSSVGDDQFIFSQYNLEPIGSGQYRFKNIKRNRGGIPTSYVLSSWNGYYGKKPYMDDIVFNFFEDESSALSALDQGIIDSLPSISPEAAARLADDSAQAYKIISSPLPRVFGVFFNQNESPVLADRAVRIALDAAIDRQMLVDSILQGYGTPLGGPIPSTSSDLDPKTDDGALLAASSTLEAAQTILERNGWKRGPDGIYGKKLSASGPETFIVFDIYTADSPDLKRAAEMVMDTWNALGAQVSLKIYETGDLYQNIIRTRKYDALLFGQSIGKDRDLYAFWHSSQRNSPGLNVALYTNSKADQLLEKIRGNIDPENRNEAYEEFESVLREDVPAVFLYMPDFIYAIPKILNEVNLNHIGSAPDRWNNIRDWYTETEHVWKIFDK